ncbi:MAG: hypothetical protein WC516_05525 [Patescibacteria group bacterium]|jgi:cysteinyl-tRNA synthetase
MSFSKILNHPSADLIIRKLSKGESVREVANLIEEMYPNNKKLHISYLTLQKFRKEHMKIEGDALEIIKEATKEKQIEKETKKEHTQVKNFTSYKEKVKEAVNLHIDVRQQLASLHSLIMSRAEALFDKLSEGQGSKSDEENLQKYFNTYITVLEKWAKFVDKIADYTVETNVNITVIENQMALLREAVWEIMREIDPKIAVKFLEKLDYKMKTFQYRQDKKLTLREMDSDVKTLTAQIEESDEDGNGN